MKPEDTKDGDSESNSSSNNEPIVKSTFWCSFSIYALIICVVCVSINHGDSAIAAAIVFATAIYAFKNDI